MPQQSDAPGLKSLKRKSGRVDHYWVAPPAMVKRGYTPKTVRLHYDDTESDRAEMVAQCLRLQAQMLDWASGGHARPMLSPQGTVAWLVDMYQTDEESPYREVREATRRTYDSYLKKLKATVGDRRIDAVNGRDVRRWYKAWRHPEGPLGPDYGRTAYGCIQLLRIVVKFGGELRDNACLQLTQILSDMEFENPSKRRQRMSFGQVTAFRAKARELGFPSMARAIAIQFAAMLRQKDVIGEWVREDGKPVAGGISYHGKRWQWGLLWGEHLSRDLVLRKPTSKSNGNEISEHDLSLFADVVAELADADMVGPVIKDESTGRPYSTRHFADRFRLIARAAGIPDDVWNMDSRAGAVTEAYDAGATPVDVMKSATHTQLRTSKHYDRSGLEKSTRVAELRLARRNSR